MKKFTQNQFLTKSILIFYHKLKILIFKRKIVNFSLNFYLFYCYSKNINSGVEAFLSIDNEVIKIFIIILKYNYNYWYHELHYLIL